MSRHWARESAVCSKTSCSMCTAVLPHVQPHLADQVVWMGLKISSYWEVFILFSMWFSLPVPEAMRKIRMYEGPPVSKPAVPPARNPPSRVVFIQHLVRPFTINQLRELLQRTGRLVDNGFWIDNIKSKCLAMVSVVCVCFRAFPNILLHG